ncbi:glycine cleavage system protein R [Pseudomonas syringae]|nr:glycine cleavage system protein R [Pseudomonas syringae]MBD8576222.1 glycine cleavage system protein R [Pseudomonas syringae]MBD8791854.1 glycine cleavage system protein R [Pseudomonas syringae]MBD8802639.1 glycine cleavage system protein R [Pseudomonas syringae]MBD8813211.1 glycine cleavage system protein R [Pseudomonas syringae]
MNHLVVTVVAPDKPGQVERIAHCIAEHGGNWLESRMSRLAGQFAGILRLSVPLEQRDALVTALHELAAHDIRVLLAEESEEATVAWTPIHMALVGTDRPGIVRDITRLLAGQGVNVERLVTEVMTAPMSGEWLFRAEAVLGVPATVTLDDLQARLETLADDLMVELELREDPAA